MVLCKCMVSGVILEMILGSSFDGLNCRTAPILKAEKSPCDFKLSRNVQIYTDMVLFLQFI